MNYNITATSQIVYDKLLYNDLELIWCYIYVKNIDDLHKPPFNKLIKKYKNNCDTYNYQKNKIYIRIPLETFNYLKKKESKEDYSNINENNLNKQSIDTNKNTNDKTIFINDMINKYHFDYIKNARERLSEIYDIENKIRKKESFYKLLREDIIEEIKENDTIVPTRTITYSEALTNCSPFLDYKSNMKMLKLYSFVSKQLKTNGKRSKIDKLLSTIKSTEDINIATSIIKLNEEYYIDDLIDNLTTPKSFKLLNDFNKIKNNEIEFEILKEEIEDEKIKHLYYKLNRGGGN